MSPVESDEHQELALESSEMTLPMSYGLQQLLHGDPAYMARYEHLVRHVENLHGMELIKEYEAEHNSWKNRKHWAKMHGVHWSPVMDRFGDFLLVNGPIPQPHWTLDRIDPSGHYVPENLRWASKAVQSQNRTSARRIIVDGQSLSISEIAYRTGRPYDAVRVSLNRHGDEYAIHLLNNPLVNPEYAWQFPEEYREALEELYANRRHQDWSRLYFFIDLTERDYYRLKDELLVTEDEKARHALEIELATLRELHNSTLRLYLNIHAEAESRRRFPNVVAPKRIMNDDQPDDSDYWYWPDGLH